MIKSLVEFAQAVIDCLMIQEDHGENDDYDWQDFDMKSYNVNYVMELIEDEKLRIKPSITYIRVYLDQRHHDGSLVTLESGKPFENNNPSSHDFEVEEQPVKPSNETITLYEHSSADHISGFSFWTDRTFSPGIKQTGRTGTLVIKGDIS